MPRDTAIDITLGNGTQKVQTESIQLFVNGQSVTPAISPWNAVQQPWTYIHYRPSQILPAQTNITVKLVFNDDATPPSITIREFRFTTAPDITVLVALDDQQMWRYDESGQDSGTAWKERVFDDSSWKSGAALFEGKKGTVPALPEPVRTTLTVATNKTTFYFRTHFNFPADPRGTKLKIKCLPLPHRPPGASATRFTKVRLTFLQQLWFRAITSWPWRRTRLPRRVQISPWA
ncbi:MAG: hypothetical protein DMG78_31665 [Acidobacteria bacterium]|nr:MAG: hypothetical protein DMG78_31665 [Acidobacteriota bacterium]